ncbi:MAG: hypothetical protein QMD71_03415 [bacterium]|nr:hypothetical protein [bacterium]
MGSEVLSPRKKLVSVGYAMKAKNANNAIYADTANYAQNLIGKVSYADSAGHIVPPDSVIGVVSNNALLYIRNDGMGGYGLKIRASSEGIHIDSTYYGVYIYSPVFGVKIDMPIYDGLCIDQAGNNGVWINGAGGDGVYAVATQRGGYFYNNSTGTNYPTLWVRNAYNSTSSERIANFYAGVPEKLRFYFQGDGNAYADVGWNTFKKNSKGSYESYSAVESQYKELIAHRTGKLVNGEAYVKFDASFAEFVSAQLPIEITLTPVGSYSGLYVVEKDKYGFTVKSGAGDNNCEFSYLAIGREKGCEQRAVVGNIDEEERQAQLMDEMKRAEHERRMESKKY